VRLHSGWGRSVDSQFACLLGCNNAARIQQIVRFSCLSRPLQAPPKTSADLRSEVSSSDNQPHLLGLNNLVRATGRAVSGNARAASSLKADILLLRGESYLLCRSFVCPFVRPFRERAPEAPYIVTRRCLQPASYVHPSVRAAAAVDRAKSVRLDRTPIPAVCSLHTCQAHTYVKCYCKINRFRRTYKSLSV
jgi:hypothetical protein